MLPEIEKLMNIALQDGVITDKEREILLRKCEQLGMDKDEFEMMLEGELSKITQTKQKSSIQSNKFGDIKKCPSCNAEVPTFSTKCNDCGFEFRNVEANKSVTELSKKLDEVVIEVNKMKFKGESQDDKDELRKDEIIARQRQTIQNFPIPNNREDLLELFHFIIPKILNGVATDEELYAWKNKFDEVLNRAKFAYKDDSKMLLEFQTFEDKIHKKTGKEKKKKIIVFIILICLIVVSIVVLLFRDKNQDKEINKEKVRLELIQKEINIAIEKKDYESAELKCSELTWELTGFTTAQLEDLKTPWDTRRKELLETIRKLRETKNK